MALTSKVLVLAALLSCACIGEAGSKLAITDGKLPSPEFGHGRGWVAKNVEVSASNGTPMWDVRARLGVEVAGVNRIRYGTLPDGFIEYVAAQPLVSGECYKIATDAAPAGGEVMRFHVVGDHVVAGCDPLR